MSVKKLINSPNSCVPDAIEGMLAINPFIKRLQGFNVLIRRDIMTYRQSHVTLISGGGSGHEPAHAGYIGEGCLSGAVLGNIFASPSVSAILAAIRICGGSMGTLLVVKNYTGDRLNFGMAMEQAKQEGIDCKMVIVEDDCALPHGKGITGGRGVAGTVFIHKIAGAAAANGLSLDKVASIALWTAKHVGSMGLALTTCTIPGTPVSTRLSSSSRIIEIGMGIHGEPGREQIEIPLENAASILAKSIVDGIIGDNVSYPSRLPIISSSSLSATQKLAVLINNLGGLPTIEMLIMSKEIMTYLKSRNLRPIRVYVGSYMTSLEMAGISLSLLTLPDDSMETTDILSLLDQSTSAQAWIKSFDLTEGDGDDDNNADATNMIAYDESVLSKKIYGGPPSVVAVDIVKAVCQRIIEVEPILTQYDSICGDGDCGIVMKAGAKQILFAFFESPDNQAIQSKISCDSAILCDELANHISSSMGGTSGALLELFFRAIAVNLANTGMKKFQNGETYLADALSAGTDAMKFYGGASVGMRTMLDSLIPAVEALKSGWNMKDVVDAAIKGMEATKSMESFAGRSNYVSKSQMEGTPDPGAVAVAEAFITASTYL